MLMPKMPGEGSDMDQTHLSARGRTLLPHVFRKRDPRSSRSSCSYQIWRHVM